MAGSLRVQAENCSGLCVLRVSGELDLVAAEEFGERADRAVQTVPGFVVVDLTGLTFIDARGARALAAVIRTLPDGRMGAIRGCPPDVRLVLDVLGLSMDYLPADRPWGEHWTVPHSWTFELVTRVQDARLHASVARLQTKSVLARLTDSSIRLASIRERTDLIREQGREALASSRAARAHDVGSGQETAR